MSLPQPDASAGDLIDRVAAHLPTTGRLGIAYSGGVDSATLLAIVPVAIVFLLSQRALVRGLVGGAVKE